MSAYAAHAHAWSVVHRPDFGHVKHGRCSRDAGASGKTKNTVGAFCDCIAGEKTVAPAAEAFCNRVKTDKNITGEDCRVEKGFDGSGK
jgi:hypothetical protein